MGSDANDDRASQNSGGNNWFPPPDIYNPPMLFCHLKEEEKQHLLNETGYLYGFFLDGHAGPRRSSRPVARQRDNAPHAYNSIQERNDMVTEVVESKSERDANFAHQGWSVSDISTNTPWIASRIAKRNRGSGGDPWVTKRVVVQRLAFTLALQDLEPAPEFEGDVRTALDKANKLEKFQALDKVFRLWGDVIPIEFDLGIALSISDSKADFTQSLSLNTPIQLDHLTMFKSAMINTQGGDANFLPSGDAKSWLSRVVPPQQWSQVRVSQVAPLTDLLNPELKSRITELYSVLLSNCPPSLGKPLGGGQHFGGGAHGLKTIWGLDIRSGAYINDICTIYLDGTRSDGQSDKGGEPSFPLNSGEHITEVMVWSDTYWVYALQFITSCGRVSSHFGGDGGTLTIMSAEDGVLVALPGSKNSDTVSEIQTVWRHDVLKTKPSHDKYLKYFGGASGAPFNDRGFLNSLEDTYITSINVRHGTYIEAIQVTYQNGRASESKPTPWHGGLGSKEKLFELLPQEYIVQVQGRHNDYVVQLCFKTNLGRTSTIYGGGEGTPFCCEPPQKRLSYIAGKSGKWVNGLLFVWVPLTEKELAEARASPLRLT